MSQKELQKYVLAHREDKAAFYAYIDRLHAGRRFLIGGNLAGLT